MRNLLKVWRKSPAFRELGTGIIALLFAIVDCIIAVIALCFQCYPLGIIACVAIFVHFCCAGWFSPD